MRTKQQLDYHTRIYANGLMGWDRCESSLKETGSGTGQVKGKWRVQISSEVAVYGQMVGRTNLSICLITSEISSMIMYTFTLGLCLGS